MQLDRSRSYGQVCGVPGVMWEQDGQWFRLDGTPASPVPITEPETQIPEPHQAEPAVEIPPDSKFKGMHWKKLRVLVESYGHEWVNVSDAVAFLEGKSQQ